MPDSLLDDCTFLRSPPTVLLPLGACAGAHLVYARALSALSLCSDAMGCAPFLVCVRAHVCARADWEGYAFHARKDVHSFRALTSACANAEIVYAHALSDLLFCPDAMNCASFLVFYGSVHTLVRTLRARTRVRSDAGLCFCVRALERARAN